MCYFRRFVESSFIVGLSLLTVGIAVYVASPKTHVIQHTGGSSDFAIVGSGYFQLYDPIGEETRYTRRGRFVPNEYGDLVLIGTRFLVDPRVNVSPDSVKVRILPTGEVLAMEAGDDRWFNVGQIALARFTRPNELARTGGDVFAVTGNSGIPLVGQPGEAGLGYIQAEWIESRGQILDRIDILTFLAVLTTVFSILIHGKLAALLRRQEPMR